MAVCRSCSAPRGDERGFTLVELVVAALIAVAVIAGATALVAQTAGRSTVYVQASALQEMIGSAASVRTSGGYPSNLIPALRVAGLLPAAFTDPGGAFVLHAWDGAVRFTSSGANDLTLAVEALPTTACTALARSLSSSDRNFVEAGGQQIPSGNDAAAIAACSSDNTTLRLKINN